jgi:hypothetical protein
MFWQMRVDVELSVPNIHSGLSLQRHEEGSIKISKFNFYSVRSSQISGFRLVWITPNTTTTFSNSFIMKWMRKGNLLTDAL